MKTAIAFATLLTTSLSTQADTYDPNTQILTIPSVTVGSTNYPNLVVKLNKFTVLKTGISCNETSNLIKNKITLLQNPMTLSQVTNILGCNYNSIYTTKSGNLIRYIWTTPGLDYWVKIYFNSRTKQIATATEIYNQFNSYVISNICYKVINTYSFCS